MKYIYHYLLISTIVFGLASCGNTSKPSNQGDTAQSEDTDSEPSATETGAKACTYTYIHDSTSVSFTAYKFESKAGVGGTFKECEVFPLISKGTVTDVIKGMEFRIPVSSTSTNNDDRDKKIKENFWGSLTNTEYITGEIIDVTGSDENGTVKIKLTLNGSTQDIEGSYSVNQNGHIELTTEVDLTDFDGLEAIAKLNKVCEDLHREAPGQKSMLWPNVGVKVSGYLAKDCK